LIYEQLNRGKLQKKLSPSSMIFTTIIDSNVTVT